MSISRVVFVIQVIVKFSFWIRVSLKTGYVCGAHFIRHVSYTVKGKGLSIFCYTYRRCSKAFFSLVLIACSFYAYQLVQAVVRICLLCFVGSCVVIITEDVSDRIKIIFYFLEDVLGLYVFCFYCIEPSSFFIIFVPCFYAVSIFYIHSLCVFIFF